MINVRRVNIVAGAIILLGLVSVIRGEIVGHRAVTVIACLLVGIPLPYLFIRRDMRKLDLRVMNGKYHWLIDKAFAGEKRSYKKLLLSLGYFGIGQTEKGIKSGSEIETSVLLPGRCNKSFDCRGNVSYDDKAVPTSVCAFFCHIGGGTILCYGLGLSIYKSYGYGRI